jgi:hypothetical protein
MHALQPVLVQYHAMLVSTPSSVTKFAHSAPPGTNALLLHQHPLLAQVPDLNSMLPQAPPNVSNVRLGNPALPQLMIHKIARLVHMQNSETAFVRYVPQVINAQRPQTLWHAQVQVLNSTHSRGQLLVRFAQQDFHV